MKFFAVVLITVLSLYACNTEEVTPIIGSVSLDDLLGNDTLRVLTLSVDTSWRTDHTDNWIFINDSNGKTIASAPFESGDQLEIKAFMKQKPASVNVSLLEVNKSESIFYLRSYSGIQRDLYWHVTRLVEQKRKPIGPVSIIINNAPRPPANHYQVSDDFGSSSFDINYTPGTAIIGYNLFESTTKIAISVSTFTNETRYLQIENPGLFDNFNFDFNDFTYLNHQSVLLLGQNNFVSAKIRGLKDLAYDKKIDQKGIVLTEVLKLSGADKVYLGYNGGFPFYYTELKVNTEKYHYHYEKLGPAPDFGKMQVPKKIPLIADAGFSTFSISGADDYDHLHAVWNGSSMQDKPGYKLNWLIFSDMLNYPGYLELPVEIKNTYPALDFDYDQMQLETVTVNRNISGYGYNDMIGDLFKSNTEDYRPHEYEYFIIRK
jgi:hypothetical protein